MSDPVITGLVGWSRLARPHLPRPWISHLVPRTLASWVSAPAGFPGSARTTVPRAGGVLFLDLPGRAGIPAGPEMTVSGENGAGVEELWDRQVGRALDIVPRGTDLALNQRQAKHCREALEALHGADERDELILADSLRRAIAALSRITGDTGVESMLDALFARFCIGK